jgi:UDP-N-acetylmuramyl pentapeptide synthase
VPVRGAPARSVNVFGQSVTLIDDTYNANPDSMQAASRGAVTARTSFAWSWAIGEVGSQGRYSSHLKPAHWLPLAV